MGRRAYLYWFDHEFSGDFSHNRPKKNQQTNSEVFSKTDPIFFLILYEIFMLGEHQNPMNEDKLRKNGRDKACVWREKEYPGLLQTNVPLPLVITIGLKDIESRRG